MKRWFKKILIGVLVGVLFLSGTWNGIAENGIVEETDANSSVSALGLADGFNQMLENERFVVSLHQSTYEISLLDRETDTVWYSNPQDREEDDNAYGQNKAALNAAFILTYRNNQQKGTQTTNSYSGSILDGEVRVVEGKTSFTVYYKFNSIKCVVPIRYELDREGLSCSVVADKIVEAGDYELLTISLLPFFGAGSNKEEGYMLVPDGSGSLIYFNNGKTSYRQYNEKVYGWDDCISLTSDASRKQTVRLPVFGIRKGQQGFLAVITQGDSLASVGASISGVGHSYNQVNATFQLRATDTYILGESTGSTTQNIALFQEELNAEELTVKFFPLTKENTDYSGMARAYRTYLCDRYNRSVEMAQSTMHLELIGAVQQTELFLGVLPITQLVPITDFDAVEEIVGDLKDLGVEAMDVRYVGWNRMQLQGKVTTKGRVLGSLGGNRGLKSALKTLEEQQASLYLDVDFYSIRKWNSGYTKNNAAIRTVNNKQANIPYYDYLHGYKDAFVPTTSILSPIKVSSVAQKFLNSFKKIPDVNFSLGNIASKVPSDFGKDGWSRQDSANAYQEMAQLLKRENKLMAQGGNAYVLASATAIVDAPMTDSRFNVTDISVPFYQIAVSGLATYSYEALNLEGDLHQSFLKHIETGACLHFVFGAEDRITTTELSHLYSLDPQVWYDKVAEYSKAVNELAAATKGFPLRSHRILQENVYETTYENGTRVIVNYNAADVTVEDIQVEAEDYVILTVGGNGNA